VPPAPGRAKLSPSMATLPATLQLPNDQIPRPGLQQNLHGCSARSAAWPWGGSCGCVVVETVLQLLPRACVLLGTYPKDLE
jgi:hypothetical protein